MSILQQFAANLDALETEIAMFCSGNGQYHSVSHFSQEMAAERERIKTADIALRARREQARQKAMERMASGTLSVIAAYNDAFQVEDCLLAYGYKQHGQRYLSPNSSSGSPGVAIPSQK